MKNTDIRDAAKQKKVYLYAVAEQLGISESTMTRLLRHELSKAKKTQILAIIDQIVSDRKTVSREDKDEYT